MIDEGTGMLSNALRTVFPLLAGSVMLVGCVQDTAGGKAGGDPVPVRLRIATSDLPGRPAADAIAEFARQTSALSGGAIRIDPVWQAAGLEADDWDQAVGRMVISGAVEMGVIPTRAWDTEGVTSLRALQAPFLVTSDELVKRIVTGELAGELLGGLDVVGLTGLALLPEGLRHPFAFGGSLISPQDFADVVIRSPRSDTDSRMFEALGARADDWKGGAFNTAAHDGTIAAADASFVLAPFLPARSVGTANITFFPKVNSLVINTEVLTRLTAQQRDVLRRAASQTQSWVLSTAPSESDAAAQFCRGGGRIVLAGEDALLGLERLTLPVYDELERDPLTKSLISRIRELKKQIVVPPATGPLTGCRKDQYDMTPGSSAAPESSRTAGPATGSTAESAVNGIYRFEITDADLLANGVTRKADLLENHGLYTCRLEDGKWRLDIQAPNPQWQSIYEGTYQVAGDRIAFVFPPDGLPPVVTLRWVLAGDELRFELTEATHPNDKTMFTARPWTKIG